MQQWYEKRCALHGEKGIEVEIKRILVGVTAADRSYCRRCKSSIVLNENTAVVEKRANSSKEAYRGY